jgi:hypothetical protein
MRLILDTHVAMVLETIANQVRGSEFSGFGFITRNGTDITIDDFILMDVGSTSYTEISSKEMLELMSHPRHRDMRVWIHLHPVGNGVPGPHNWSGTDNKTIETAPLGGVPEMVRWSISIVRTPQGWVGRMDNHLEKKTLHLEVEGQAGSSIYAQAAELTDRYRARRYESLPLANPSWLKHPKPFHPLIGFQPYIDTDPLDDGGELFWNGTCFEDFEGNFYDESLNPLDENGDLIPPDPFDVENIDVTDEEDGFFFRSLLKGNKGRK